MTLCLLTFLHAANQGYITADIRTMLPEGEKGALADDFNMLSQSSLSNNIFITLKADEGVPRETLLAAAKTLQKKLQPPNFSIVDASSVNPAKVINFLLDNAPNLMDANDLEKLNNTLTPDAIRTTLQKALHQLSSPQGMVVKQFIRKDPLSFRSVLAPRLKPLNVLSNASIIDGHLFSKTGDAILITAESSIPMTDANGAELLVQQFNDATAELPDSVHASMLCGHVHTLANASTIKSDLVTISFVALLALTILFALYFRSTQAIGVFLVPLGAMVLGLGALTLFCSPISAIVIGFGSVLIGISIDFAMHVYFAIARRNNDPGAAVEAITRPIIFCALTSCAAFGALFLSGIPGIRQLALFSITGLIGSALLSLLVLPHLSRFAKTVKTNQAQKQDLRPRSQFIFILWIALMGISLWFGSSVQINPDLQAIGYVPEEVSQAEQDFAATWGDVRNRAIIFSQAETMEDALTQNQRVYDALTESFPDTAVTSVAPLLPAPSKQADNRNKWTHFWTQKKEETVFSSLEKESRSLGFSGKAFAPFKQTFSAIPNSITPNSLETASLSIVKKTFFPASDTTAATVLTFLPDTKAVQTFFSPQKEEELGVRLVSNGRFKAALETAMDSDITYFISISGLAVSLLALCLFRNIRRTALALLPAVTGIITVFGVLGLTNTDLNLFHITALPLIIGLGADYGIFMVNREAQHIHLDTFNAVKVSGLTTLAGFGVLTLAKHPSLHSLGVTVLVGIGAALFCALYVMPSLTRSRA